MLWRCCLASHEAETERRGQSGRVWFIAAAEPPRSHLLSICTTTSRYFVYTIEWPYKRLSSIARPGEARSCVAALDKCAVEQNGDRIADFPKRLDKARTISSVF
jgi:hypothetical protein